MIPERYAPYTYALFRIVVGMLFFFFGMQKMAGLVRRPGGAADVAAGCRRHSSNPSADSS